MARVVRPLRAMGAEIVEKGDPGRLPLEVRGRALRGETHRIEVASAQVKSAILLAGLAAEGATTVEEPSPSRDHTERMLRAMGARIETKPGRVRLDPGSIEAVDVAVPGDVSSAAFFLALAAASGGEAIVDEVGLNPGRTGFLDLLARMGAEVVVEDDDRARTPSARSDHRPGRGASGIDVTAVDVPRAIDELPPRGRRDPRRRKTRVTGAAELGSRRATGSRRSSTGSPRWARTSKALADGFVVRGPTALTGSALDAHGDHGSDGARGGGLPGRGPSTLAGAEWVDVSYPGFFEALAGCAGAKVIA